MHNVGCGGDGPENTVNWKGEKVSRFPGHEWSPLDAAMNEPPIVDPGPFTAEQRQGFLGGNSGGTKLSPHHRHQLSVQVHGGVIDEIPGHGHPSGNQYTKAVDGVAGHKGASYFRNVEGGEALRDREIYAHRRAKGLRLVPDPENPGMFRDNGPE